MSVLEIKTFPDPILKNVCEQITNIDESVDHLAKQMVETLHQAPGVGLAATQVGVLKRLVVVDVSCGKNKDDLIILVNPVIVSKEGETSSLEGCLSVPEYTGKVKRSNSVFVKYTDLKENAREVEGNEFLACVLQHEIDHLDGILFIDRLSRLRRELVKKRLLKRLTNK